MTTEALTFAKQLTNQATATVGANSKNSEAVQIASTFINTIFSCLENIDNEAKKETEDLSNEIKSTESNAETTINKNQDKINELAEQYKLNADKIKEELEQWKEHKEEADEFQKQIDEQTRIINEKQAIVNDQNADPKDRIAAAAAIKQAGEKITEIGKNIGKAYEKMKDSSENVQDATSENENVEKESTEVIDEGNAELDGFKSTLDLLKNKQVANLLKESTQATVKGEKEAALAAAESTNLITSSAATKHALNAEKCFSAAATWVSGFAKNTLQINDANSILIKFGIPSSYGIGSGVKLDELDGSKISDVIIDNSSYIGAMVETFGTTTQLAGNYAEQTLEKIYSENNTSSNKTDETENNENKDSSNDNEEKLINIDTTTLDNLFKKMNK